MSQQFKYLPDARLARLIDLFDQCFFQSHNTRLIGGGEEPLFAPAGDNIPWDRLVFTRDYFASALHEIAHWCVAGAARRKLPDYGYWYEPDGRSAERQREFERVEVKPQAMERIFARAAGQVFRVSADNLAQGLPASQGFVAAVHRQTLWYCEHGLPPRAQAFALALARAFAAGDPLQPEHYAMDDLL